MTLRVGDKPAAFDNLHQSQHGDFEFLPAHVGLAAVQGDDPIAHLPDKWSIRFFHQHLRSEPQLGITFCDRRRNVGRGKALQLELGVFISQPSKEDAWQHIPNSLFTLELNLPDRLDEGLFRQPFWYRIHWAAPIQDKRHLYPALFLKPVG